MPFFLKIVGFLFTFYKRNKIYIYIGMYINVYIQLRKERERERAASQQVYSKNLVAARESWFNKPFTVAIKSFYDFYMM